MQGKRKKGGQTMKMSRRAAAWMVVVVAMVVAFAGNAQAQDNGAWGYNCWHNFVRYDGTCISTNPQDNNPETGGNDCNVCHDGRCYLKRKECWGGSCATWPHLRQDMHRPGDWGNVQEVYGYCL